MPHFQSQAAQSPFGTHHGHTSLRACSPWLAVSGTQVRSGGKCSGNISFSLDTPKCMFPKPKPPRPLPKPCGTSSMFIMGYPKRSCQIKVGILKVSSWLTSVSWWGPKSYNLAHTTHRLMASVRGSTPLWLVCWECYPTRRNQEWKNDIGALVHTYICTQNSTTGFSPYYLMYGRQLHFPVDVTLGVASHSIMAPTTSKFMQKMWIMINYDKRSKAVALEVGTWS